MASFSGPVGTSAAVFLAGTDLGRSGPVGASAAVYRPSDYDGPIGQSYADYLAQDAYSATYYDAAAAPVVLGDITGAAVRAATLDEGHLKPVVALYKAITRQRQAAGVSLVWSLPANRPQAFEVIEWCVRATAGGAGILNVTLGGSLVLLTVAVPATGEVRASGLLMHMSSDLVVSWAHGRTSAGVAIRRIDLGLSGASRQLLAQLTGGVVRTLEVEHAGRAT